MSEGVAKPLTSETLRAAFDAIKNAPPHPCSLGQHVVGMKAYRRGGWTMCANCGRAVFLDGD